MGICVIQGICYFHLNWQIYSQTLFLTCCGYSHNPVRLFATPWTVTCQVPLSTGILQARILKWVANYLLRGWMFLIQGLNPRLLCLLHWQVDSLPLAPPRQFSVFSDNVLKGQRNKRNSLLGKRFKITIENTLINYFRKNTS